MTADTPAAMEGLTAYLWATPNARRVSILLEELGLAYVVRPVNIRAGEQAAPDVRARNPYGRIPILVWREGGVERSLFESGAILLHLAERHGRFLPSEGPARADTLAWLMVALTSLAPLSGQAHHWTALASERPEAAVRHHVGLIRRTYDVLEARCAEAEFLAGAYSIADIAAYPWVERVGWTGLDLAAYPNLGRWAQGLAARPGVIAGMAVPAGVTMD